MDKLPLYHGISGDKTINIFIFLFSYTRNHSLKRVQTMYKTT